MSFDQQGPAAKKSKVTETGSSIWQQVEKIDNEGRVKCRHCGKIFPFTWHRKVERLRSHFGIDANLQRTSNKLSECGLHNPFDTISGGSQSAGSIIKFAVPKMTEVDIKRSQKLLAEFFFQTGTPFSRVEHKTLADFAQSLRSDFRPFTAKTLSGRMLTDRYLEVKELVNVELKDAVGRNKICLTTDGWSTQHRMALVNYMAVYKGNAFFYDSELTGDEPHDAEHIAHNLTQMIQEIGPEKVCGAATDNTSANR